MSKINNLWDELQGMLRGYFVGLLEVDGSGRFRNPQGDDNGNAYVVFPSGATVPLPTGAATESTVDEVTGASVAASATGEITKSDATVYSPPLKVIWATGAGVITVMLADDTVSVIPLTVTANERVTFLRIKKVMSTGTTATGIYGAS